MVNVHKVSAPVPQYTDTLVEVPIKSSGLSTLANLKDQNTLCCPKLSLLHRFHCSADGEILTDWGCILRVIAMHTIPP